METTNLPYDVKNVASWAEAQALFDSLQDAWVFRGQCDARHDLSTLLERRILNKVRDTYTSEQLLALEHTLTKKFKRGASIYYTDSLLPTNTLGWWAEMQHYGMPTRLLDFSWSPYVASFFAMEDGTKECDRAIWALHLDSDQANMTRQHAQIADFIATEFGDSVVKDSLYSGDFWDDPTLVDAFLKAAQTKQFHALIYMETDQMNQRMLGQQGVFVMPSSIDVSFMECLALPGDDAHAASASLIKIVLPDTMRREVLFNLMRMNVTRSSLFPGLAGFARMLGDNLEQALVERTLKIPASE